MRRAGLRGRLARLAPAPQPPFTAPRMVFGVYGAVLADIVGIAACGGSAISRDFAEPIVKLINRGHIECESQFLHLVHDTSVEDETPSQLPPLPTPADEPVDPFALAGIGKTDLKYVGWWQSDD